MLPSWTHVQIWIDGEWKILFIFSTSFKLLLGFETTTTKKTNNNSKNKNQTLIHPNSDSIRAATQFKYTVLDKKLHQFNTTEFQMTTNDQLNEHTCHGGRYKARNYLEEEALRTRNNTAFTRCLRNWSLAILINFTPENEDVCTRYIR